MKKQTLGVLPPPTFKYGGRSYVLLSYAKMKNKPFGIESVLRFTGRFVTNKDVRRSAKVLIENGSLVEVSEDMWRITPDGAQQLIDFRTRRQNFSYDQQTKR
jgi:hypothetical protein